MVLLQLYVQKGIIDANIHMRTHYSLGTDHSKYNSASVTIETIRVAFQGDLLCHVKKWNRNHHSHICQMAAIFDFHILWSRNHMTMSLFVWKTCKWIKEKMCHGTLKLCRCCYLGVKNYVAIQKDWELILPVNDLK